MKIKQIVLWGKMVWACKFDMFVLWVKNGWIEKVEKTGL